MAGKGVVATWKKLKVAILKEKLLIIWSFNLLRKLEMSFPFLISQKPGEIQDLEIF